MKNLLLFILVALLVAACAYTRVIPLKDKTYPPIPIENVTIFVDEADLPVEFEKVAIITTDYSSGYDETKWKSVKKKCASIGCNGVYQKFEKRATTGEKIAGAIFGYSTSDKAEFIAIKYKPEDN